MIRNKKFIILIKTSINHIALVNKLLDLKLYTIKFSLFPSLEFLSIKSMPDFHLSLNLSNTI